MNISARINLKSMKLMCVLNRGITQDISNLEDVCKYFMKIEPVFKFSLVLESAKYAQVGSIKVLEMTKRNYLKRKSIRHNCENFFCMHALMQVGTSWRILDLIRVLANTISIFTGTDLSAGKRKELLNKNFDLLKFFRDNLSGNPNLIIAFLCP